MQLQRGLALIKSNYKNIEYGERASSITIRAIQQLTAMISFKESECSTFIDVVFADNLTKKSRIFLVNQSCQ